MPYKILITIAWFILWSARLGLAADAPDWRSWRGPQDSGSIELGNYPVRFGADRLLWRTELPGKGCSTPIVLNQMIYLTSPVEASAALLCYDIHGSERWRAVFSKENPGKHRNGL